MPGEPPKPPTTKPSAEEKAATPKRWRWSSTRRRSVTANYIAQLDAARIFAAPIATRVSPPAAFYPAEPYHQDFAARNPKHPYIVFHDKPKVEALRRAFPERYLEKPTLLDQK